MSSNQQTECIKNKLAALQMYAGTRECDWPEVRVNVKWHGFTSSDQEQYLVELAWEQFMFEWQTRDNGHIQSDTPSLVGRNNGWVRIGDVSVLDRNIDDVIAEVGHNDFFSLDDLEAYLDDLYDTVDLVKKHLEWLKQMIEKEQA
jgi:hypothetical protein